jgi:predicted PhzF superfamily epimerase YddE/YHI9
MRDLLTVDAFSEVPFKGNPAAVVLLHAHDEISDAVLQAIAEELNLSETAFVRPIAGGDTSGEYSLRWFTPTNEVPLCGHATLASAHSLFSHPSRGASLPRILRFSTLSGQLTVERLSDGDLCMVLPLNTPAVCSQVAYGFLAPLYIFYFHACFHQNTELFVITRFPSDAFFPLQILADCFHCFWWPHRCCCVAFYQRQKTCCPH